MIASRVMLVVYPVFAAGIGLSFTTTPTHRLRETPSTRYLDDLVGIGVVGIVFLALAALLAVALVARRRQLAVLSLGALASWLIAYATVTLLAALNGQASFSAWLWPGFVAAACWATMLSLLSRET